MSTRLLEGTYDGTHEGRVVLVDSTTEWAFGPVFESREDAEAFLAWCPIDVKRLRPGELADAVWRFRQSRKSRGEGPAGQGGEAGPGKASGSPVVGPGADGR